MSGVFEGLTPPYSTIVADPPWRYESAATKADAGKHYSTMSMDDLRAMPVVDLAATDAHLWIDLGDDPSPDGDEDEARLARAADSGREGVAGGDVAGAVAGVLEEGRSHDGGR
jgi:hypothetical protein